MPETRNQEFVRAFLPWAVAGIFLLLYLVTLNGWVTTASLPIVAKITGVDWRHDYVAPLQYVLLWPFRLLPARIQPIALNLFSAVVGALTMALLARSVRLLPHDRTPDQRKRNQRKRDPDASGLLSIRHAWLPPLVAVMLCGLQLTFWESATAISGEMIDLLIFAYAIRCLLEYRVSKNEKWLSKLALAYGLGVTSNWALIAYFPLFLTALIWIKGLGFFNLRFLGRMLGLGLAGLLLYLLLPAVDALSKHPTGSFWEVLKIDWDFQKSMTWQSPFYRSPVLRLDLLRLGLTSLLPVLLISIRWPSPRDDLSSAGGVLTTYLLRFFHLVFLVFTIWLFLDPPFSGRKLGRGQLSFLSFYYLAALSVGYLSGYVLLVFGHQPEHGRRPSSNYFALVGRALAGFMWIAAAAIPVVLVWKNWAQIRVTNGPEMRRFARLMAQALPDKGAVIFADDSSRLLLLKAFYQQAGKGSGNLFIESGALPNPNYHRELLAAHPGFSQELRVLHPLPKQITPFLVMDLIGRLNRQYRLFYLHPSFGYYFEYFYHRPHGLIWELKPFQPEEVLPPPLTADEIAVNQKFWSETGSVLLRAIPPFRKKNREMAWLGMNYSKVLNSWGVDVQRARRWDEARDHFANALALNPENVAAFVNQRLNAELREGVPTNRTEVIEEIEKKLAQNPSWEFALAQHGPFDGMQACYRIGHRLLAGGNLRQALYLFLRALEIAPNHTAARLAVISIYVESRLPDLALAQVQILRGQGGQLPPEVEWPLLELEARSYAAKNDLATAEKRLLALREQGAMAGRADRLLLEFYMQSNRLEDALRVSETLLETDPKDTTALLNRSVVLVRMKRFAEAVTLLDELLKIDPGLPEALVNRGWANLSREKYVEARQDYESLERLQSSMVFVAYRGLGEIAEKTGQKEEAIRQYQRYLKAAPANTEEYRQLTERVNKLLGKAAPK